MTKPAIFRQWKRELDRTDRDTFVTVVDGRKLVSTCDREVIERIRRLDSSEKRIFREPGDSEVKYGFSLPSHSRMEAHIPTFIQLSAQHVKV